LPVPWEVKTSALYLSPDWGREDLRSCVTYLYGVFLVVSVVS